MYKTASKAVDTVAEPTKTDAGTQNNDGNRYIRGPRETMVPVATGRTETVQYLVSQSARPYNAALVSHSVPMLPAATASTQWHGYSRTIYPARVAVVQPGGCGDKIVDSVENEPFLGGLTQHVAGRLVVPGTFVAADMMVLMDLVQALRQCRGSW